MRLAARAAVLGVAAMFGGGACSKFDSADTTGGPAASDAGTSDAAVNGPNIPGGPPIHLSAAGSPRALTGDAVQVTLTVERTGAGAFDGPVHIELTPTSDVSAPAIDIPATATTGVMVVTFAPTRRHGRLGLLFAGSSPGLPSTGSATYNVLVRGPAGSLDTGFGPNNGIFSLGQASAASALAVDNADKVLVGGRIGAELGVVRLNEDGTLDAAYGVGGRFHAAFGALASTSDMILSSNGGMLLAATSDSGVGPRGLVVGVTTAGTLDTAFGAQGFALLSMVEATSLVASPLLGGILVGGKKTAAGGVQYLAMLKSDGSGLVTVFGANGVVETSINVVGPAASCFTRAVTLGGQATTYECASRGDGAVVASTTGAGAPGPFSAMTSLFMQTCNALAVNAGLVYVAGDDASVTRAAVARYATNGLDSTWAAASPPNPPGIARAPDGSNLTMAKRIVVQADGKVLVAADATVAGQSVIGLWRLLPTGDIDTTFASPNGWVVTAVGTSNVVVSGLAVDAEGRIVVSGSNGEMVAARFWP